jgi:hypothetical protein
LKSFQLSARIHIRSRYFFLNQSQATGSQENKMPWTMRASSVLFIAALTLMSQIAPTQCLPPPRSPSTPKSGVNDNSMPPKLGNAMAGKRLLAKALFVEAAIGLISRASMHASVMREKIWSNFDQVSVCA